MSALVCVGPVWAADEAAKPRAQFRYDARGRRDPFVALVRDGRLVGAKGGPARSAGQPVLYGILWDPGGHSIALIDGTEAKVGDMVGDYHVKEIRQDAVVLSNGGAPVVLEIAFEAPSEGPEDTTTNGRDR